MEKTIKEKLQRREQEQRPYLKHTIIEIFEGKQIVLNNRDDNEDIRLGQIIRYHNMLVDAFENEERIYFCRYESLT